MRYRLVVNSEINNATFRNDRLPFWFFRIGVSSPATSNWSPADIRWTGLAGLIFQEGRKMALFRIRPSQTDLEIAEWISDHTRPQIEQISQVLTWGADEHVICAAAVAWWLYSRRSGTRDRIVGDHILLTSFTVTLLPHLLKLIVDQKRPDRLMLRGHLHGVPLSGKPLDAFPSGHAMHVGALASAATVLSPAKRTLAWSLGAGLVATRIVLLAHWMSDVVAGIAAGIAVERICRRLTGFAAACRRNDSMTQRVVLPHN